MTFTKWQARSETKDFNSPFGTDGVVPLPEQISCKPLHLNLDGCRNCGGNVNIRKKLRVAGVELYGAHNEKQSSVWHAVQIDCGLKVNSFHLGHALSTSMHENE